MGKGRDKRKKAKAKKTPVVNQPKVQDVFAANNHSANELGDKEPMDKTELMEWVRERLRGNPTP